MNNVLARPQNLGQSTTKVFTPKKTTVNPKVVSFDGISVKDEAGVVRLYNTLVSDLSKDIDIKLIVEEGFPAFEQTIGVAEFAKVKKYFGIDSSFRGKPRETEVMSLVAKLRTVENATKYISGYKELIENVALRLEDAPEGMSVIEKAKLVRVYMVIFGEYHFFPEDFSFVQVGNKEPQRVLNTENIFRNNKKPFYPEELFFMYEMKIKFFSKGSLMYGIFREDIFHLDKRTRKEVLEFAELRADASGNFFSENKAESHTFGTVRKLKMKVSPVRGYYPIELFCNKEILKEWNFIELYSLYKKLYMTAWESFPKLEKKQTEIMGSRSMEVTRSFYQVDEDLFSGPEEMSKVVRYVDYLAEREFVLEAKYLVNNERIEVLPVNLGRFITAMKFAYKQEYISENTSVERDVEVIDALLERDTGNVWLASKRGELTFGEVAEKLQLDKKFEKEILHIKKEETPEEVAFRFAMENGGSKVLNEELIKAVLFPGNEKTIERYSAEEIDVQTFKKKIGYDEEFAGMYFNLDQVDINAIEERLHELKRSMTTKAVMRANALLINLYCYLVEEQIPCGAKMKAPKRNKGLKPQILRSLIRN